MPIRDNELELRQFFLCAAQNIYFPSALKHLIKSSNLELLLKSQDNLLKSQYGLILEKKEQPKGPRPF